MIAVVKSIDVSSIKVDKKCERRQLRSQNMVKFRKRAKFLKVSCCAAGNMCM